ncbi:hypothetical protein [Thiohalocapsa halophila]
MFISDSPQLQHLIVRDLTANITPGFQRSGAALIDSRQQAEGSALDLSVYFAGSPYAILGDGGSGVSVTAFGGNGAAGQAGGGGGNTTLAFMNGSVTTKGVEVIGLNAWSNGGDGGAGGEDSGIGNRTGEAGGNGGDAAAAPIEVIQGSFSHDGGVGAISSSQAEGADREFAAATLEVIQGSVTQDGGFGAISAVSTGGAGGGGGEGKTLTGAGHGGAGGSGGAGDAATIYLGAVTIDLTGGTGSAVLGRSVGGDGATGGEGWSDVADADGGVGGVGGDGGVVTIKSGLASFPGSLKITTTKANQHGVRADSVAGDGGTGGYGRATGLDAGKGRGGNGGPGGTGGQVTVDLAGADIATAGKQAQGVFARSYGGAGGDGGKGTGPFRAQGGAGAGSGPGGAVSVTFGGSLSTGGEDANGIFAQSVGGFSGDGGTAAGFVAYGAGDQSAGSGGDVTLTTTAGNGRLIKTVGAWAAGVSGQSVGGGGGKGTQASGIVALGGTGSAGGDGGTVTVTNAIAVETQGHGARAVSGGSHGGGGGDGGGADGVVSLGGQSGSGGDGGQVSVTNSASLTTAGDRADAIQASSVGGGGGSAHSTGGLVAIGGKGGKGGSGAAAGVVNTGALSTGGADADAVSVQSIGGGGGDGSNALSVSAGFSLAIGGAGGDGGAGMAASYADNGHDGYSISTSGERARGIFVQSVGGGGGHGGNAISASGTVLALDFAIGASGSGGPGGAGGTASASVAGGVSTAGSNASAIDVQSIGGGGGSAGTTIASANSILDLAVSVAVGGAGGGGGGASKVDAAATGRVATTGEMAHGIVAHSVGGGGGRSGTTVAGSAISPFQLTTTLGGSGGEGGAGAAVTAGSSGKLTTQGDLAYGISAASIGGGGGAAHFTGGFSGVSGGTLKTTIGGSGGSGGNGGSVGVTTGGSIETGGHMAPAVAALSIGGGGGEGGTAVSASTVSAFGNIDVTVGGGGGIAGTGDDVRVDSAAGIQTAGQLSEGIRAHSVGGGGGSSGTVVTASAVTQGNIGLTVGGDGGSGGASGSVTVHNSGGVTTAGTFASAIDAKSIAGSGGNAKGTITASALSFGNLTATVGGSGGGGGSAGTVTVNSGAPLATSGDFAHGIVAQSLGGGGGEGGYAVEAGLTAGEVSGSLNVAMGGGGGNGGLADLVDVTTTAGGTISTTGFGSHGVLGQSIGGNGGSGGNVYSGNLAFSSEGSGQVNLDLGGDGGTGGIAGKVQVTTVADITTEDYFATGILAQSIGGSGGSGGNVYTVVGTVSPTSSVNIGAAVGGSGGAGLLAGPVEVANSGTITTQKGGATAIYASSVGGGGGRAGNAANINLDLAGGGTGSKVNGALDIDVGGAGGAAGDGDAVTVTSTAALSTAGASAAGIFAQSVGGGGGDGGTASSTSFSLNGVCKLVTGGTYLCSTKEAPDDQTEVSASLTIAIGGKGGAAGDGGRVAVGSASPIKTEGALAHAIVAQSVGGGGGVGGEGSLGIEAWTTSQLAQALADLPSDFPTSIQDFASIGVGVGGSGGASGTGGGVTVENTSKLTTSGAHAFGIHAQSVGGGGGSGGAGSTGLTPNITVGGGDSGGGDGGGVTVKSPGAIVTTGKGAIGIFAQSVGGGGGTAGDVEMGLTTEDLNWGVGVGVQPNGGKGGSGGTVTVTSGDITTTGAGAHGLFAQSVGGGGGGAGISGLLGGGSTSYVGSTGAGGNGGAINLTTNGAVSTSGDKAYGIFAQSVSGSGADDTSGDVTIQVNADVSASGSGARAIAVQSQSFTNNANDVINNGKIAITVAKGATVSTGADGSETILVGDGAANTITNNGTLTQHNDASYVIVAAGNNTTTTVTNNGTINGSMRGVGAALGDYFAGLGAAAGASTLIVENRPGGLLDAGQLLDVRTLTNRGTVAVGGTGRVGSTRLIGDLVQLPGGVLAVDLNASEHSYDLLHVTGRAALGGRVSVNLVDVWQTDAGAQSVTVVTAEDGLSFDGLEVTRSAVAQYALHPMDEGRLAVQYDIDFANAGILAETNDNQDRVARHIHAIYRARALDEALARALIAVEDTPSYAHLVNTLGAEVAVDNQLTSLLSALRFNDALLGCAERSGDVRVLEQGRCGWLRLSGQHFTRDESSDNLGFDEAAWQLAGGGQLDLGNGWSVGGALSYELRDLDARDSNASSDGGQFQIGVSATRGFGGTQLSGSVSVGYGQFDIERSPFPGTSLDSTQELWLLSGQLRAAHRVEQGGWSFEPRLDLGVDHLSMDAFDESGHSDFRLGVGSDGGIYVHLQPALDIAGEIDTAEGMLIRPTLSLAITQFLGGARPSVTARFAGAPAGIAPFTAGTDLDKTRLDLAAGLEVLARRNLTLAAEVFGSLSDNSESYGGGLKVQWVF